MTAAELLWLAHEENVEYLHQHNPRRLRAYLMSVGDEELLVAHDLARMRDRGDGSPRRSR